jgi:transposase
VAEVARRHDVHPNLLHYWRRQARREIGGSLRFVPVAVAAPPLPGLASGGSIEIELGSVRVRVDAAVDEAALVRVLRALGR